MAEPAQSRSALSAILQAGPGAEPSGFAGFTIQERGPLAIVQIAEFPGTPAGRAEIETTLGVALPPARKSSGSEARSVLWVGPGRWFVVAPRSDDLASLLEHAAGGAFAVTDLSHARTVLRIGGFNAVDVLSKGCAVDLHPRSLAVGDSVVAGVARHPAILHVVDAQPAFDLYVYRSFARDMFDWLAEASAAYRYQTAP